jgi:hypothetical protein
MFKRLMGGLVIGIVMGALAATAVVKGLGIVSFLDRSILAYVAALATGAFVGLVAGKPVWARGAWIEVALKAFFGSLLAAGGMFALRKWGGMSVDLSSFGAGAGQIRDLPAATLPLIATVLSVFYELDNTDPPAAPAIAVKASKSPSTRIAPVKAASGSRVAVAEEENQEESVASKKLRN